MQPSLGPPPLPAAASVSAELTRLEAQLDQSADQWARGQLAELGDAAAARVLRKVAETGARVRNLSAFIKWLAKQEAMQRNAAGVPTAESAACSSGPFRASPQGALSNSILPPSPLPVSFVGRFRFPSIFEFLWTYTSNFRQIPLLVFSAFSPDNFTMFSTCLH